MRFRSIPKSVTFDDLERPLSTLMHYRNESWAITRWRFRRSVNYLTAPRAPYRNTFLGPITCVWKTFRDKFEQIWTHTIGWKYKGCVDMPVRFQIMWGLGRENFWQLSKSGSPPNMWHNRVLVKISTSCRFGGEKNISSKSRAFINSLQQ